MISYQKIFLLLMILSSPIVITDASHNVINNLSYTQSNNQSKISSPFLEIITVGNPYPQYVLKEYTNQKLKSQPQEISIYSSGLNMVRSKVDINQKIYISEINKNYELKLISLTEFKDINQNNKYEPKEDIMDSRLLFSKESWQFSNHLINRKQTGITEIKFNLSNDESFSSTNIKLQNRITSDQQNRLKIDIMFKDYQFKSSNNLIALEFNITGGTLGYKNDQEIIWDKAFFSFSKYANSADQGILKVFSDIESEINFYLIYQYFNSSLNHNLEFGINQKGILGQLIENEVPIYIGFLFMIVISIAKRRR